MNEQLCQIWRRCAPPFFCYLRKTDGGGGTYVPPPGRARVKVWYEYKWHTKKTSKSRSGHKSSLYVRIVIKWTIPHVQSCFSYRNCMSKDSARSTGHVGYFVPKKYCVPCKKSTPKVLVNFGFVTSLEDSHYTLLFRYIYGARVMQWFCYSKHLHVNCCSCQWSKWSIATSLSPKCYSANVPLDFCTTADSEIKYFFNEGTAGVLGNTKLIF